GGVDVVVGAPAGQVGGEQVVGAVALHHRGRLVAGRTTASEQGHAAVHGEVVGGELVDVQAVVAVLAQQVAGAVGVLEEVHVTAQVAHRAEAAPVAVGPAGGAAGGHPDPRVAVVGAVDVHVHHVHAGRRVVDDLRPFHDPARAQIAACLLGQGHALVRPAGQVGGGVAGD